MATIRIDLAAENRASREVLRLRGEINNLGEQIARNNQRTAAGTAAERAKTAETNRGLRAQQGLLRVTQQKNAITLAGLRRETGLLANVRQQTGLLSRATTGLVASLGAIGAIGVAREVFEFGRESVNAAVKVEGFRNSLTALYGDAQIANRVLDDLQELAQLPGITFQGAVEGAVRLKTVQVEGDRALNVIREFGNAAALSGATTIEMNRALVGFTQTLARGQIEQDNLNQILENVPLIGNAIRQSFNSIDAETIREQLDAAGQSVNDFADILVRQLSMGARASADTAANAFSNLRNATFELQAAIGERLLPIIADSTRGFTGFLEAITNLIEGNAFATKSADDFTEAVSGTTASVRSLLPELDEYIRRLEQQSRSRGGISSEQLEGLNEARDLYRVVSGAIAGNADAVQELETRTTSAKNALDAANTEQERLKAAIDAVDPSIRSERDSLVGLNAELAANTQRVSEAQSEYNDLNNILTSATEEVNTIRTSLASAEPPTTELRTATRTLTDTIRELPPEITAVDNAFDVLAPTTARVNAIFTEYNETLGRYIAVSGIVVSSAEAEAEALDAVTESIIQQTQDAEALADVQEVLTQRTDAHNAALVNPAISDAVGSFRRYADVLGTLPDVGGESLVVFERINVVSDRLTTSIRDQATAFDDLRDAAETAEISLDDIDDTFNRIPDAIDPSIVSMEDFETVALRALREIGDELSAFEGNLGSVGTGIDNLVTLFSNPVSFAAGTLGAVIEGLSAINEFGGPLGLPEGFFDDPVGRQARINPRNIAQNEQLAQQQVHQAGIARYLNAPDPLAQIEILRGNDPGIFQRFGTRAFIEQNFPELVDVIYPSGQGFNASGALARQDAARRTAEATGTDRQATEDAALSMYGPEDYAAEVAAATGEALSDIPEPEIPPEIADPLGTFSLTRDERETLTPYLTAVREAEDAIEDLTENSTPQEIADAYQDLVFAQTNLSRITEGIIQAAEDVGRITGTAATNAIRTLGLDLGDDIRTANNALIGSLGDVGFEVVGGIENIREAIDVSDISSAFRRIPEQVEEAAEPEPETAPALREVFSFSAGQRRILDPLNAAVSDAEEFIRNFITEDSTPEEIQAAYTALTTAEQALYDQQVEFITNATHITDETRTGALAAAGRDFDGDIRDANQTLVRALGNVGFELVNALTFTSGILMGSAAAIQRIPVMAEEAAAEVETAADEVDPVAILRSNTRLAANQVRRARTGLGESTSEADFEARRVVLIQAVNDAYTTQIALLDALGLSEADYQDRFEDAEDARDSAITRATNRVNTFAEARIKGQEDAAEAAQDAADEKIAADERAARERMRISEREQREAERAAEQQIREEMRLHDEIDDLREDAFDNEQDRQQAITDLYQDEARRREDIEEDHQDRLEDIRRRATQSREDVNREFGRDIEDILREAGADESLFRSGDFQRLVGAASSTGDQGFLRSEISRLGINLSESDFSDIRDLARGRQRDTRDLDLRTERAQAEAALRQADALEDLAQRTERREADINAQAETTATAIQTALAPLLQEQRGLSPETIQMQETTALIESENATRNTTNAERLSSATTDLGTVAGDFLSVDIPEIFGLVRESAEASIGITAAINELPDRLHGLFGRLIDNVTEVLFTFAQLGRGLGGAVREDAVGIEGIRPEIDIAAEMGILDVNVTNPVEISPDSAISDLVSGVHAEIDALRAEGLNNREIGGLIRSDLDALQESGLSRQDIQSLIRGETPDRVGVQDIAAAVSPDLESQMMMAVSAPSSITAGTVNVSGGTVNVSGGGGGGGGGREGGTVVNNITINSNTSDPDALAQEVGDSIVRQRQQGRTLV